VGDSKRGIPRSEETKKKMSIALKGHIPWMKGKCHSEKTKEKLRQAHIGMKASEETKKKMSKNNGRYWAGKHLSEEIREKIRQARKGGTSYWKGKHLLEETKKKISKANKGNIAWNKGKTGIYSKETLKKMSNASKGRKASVKARQKMSEAHKKRYRENPEIIKKISGENNKGWQGGKSFEPYPLTWTLLLKRSIRERDNYSCQLCGKPQVEELERIGYKLSVHHINYCKENCNPNNLITLCNQCHQKTNNKRKYWTKYFTKRI